jgi:hypothetical protein
VAVTRVAAGCTALPQADLARLGKIDRLQGQLFRTRTNLLAARAVRVFGNELFESGRAAQCQSPER